MRLYLSAIFHERHYIRGEWRHGWVTTHLLRGAVGDGVLRVAGEEGLGEPAPDAGLAGLLFEYVPQRTAGKE
jgi:hypothetical protein